MQPDASVLNSAGQITNAIHSENGDLTESPRNYVSETGMEATERSALINSDVQLPTPPRSENSPSSLSPREATAPPFTYDGLYQTAVPQPYAEWNSQALGMFDSAASLAGAEELQLGAPQQFIDYAQAMTDYAVYAQQNGVEFSQQYAAPYLQQQAPFSRAPQPFVGTKRQHTSDSPTVALFSQHVPVAGSKCKYTIRIRPADVGRFIGAFGSRIRQLQLRTQTVVTVCYASAPTVVCNSGDVALPSAPVGSFEPQLNSERSATLESQPGASNGRPSFESQEASIPVVISGYCNCVMEALREIYFHFPFSDFRPIDIPSIVKSELQARTNARAGQQRNSTHNGTNSAASNHACTTNGQFQTGTSNGCSKESSADPRRSAEKTGGNTKKKRKQKSKVAAQKAERDDASSNRTENGLLPHQSNANGPLTNCDSELEEKVDPAQKVGGTGPSTDDRRSLLSEPVMQKATPEGDKPAGNASRCRAENSAKQQSAPSHRASMAAKKRTKAIDIESMKDFPPLAITGGPSGDGPRRAETVDSTSKPTDSCTQDMVDGPIVEQATRALRALAVTSPADADAKPASTALPNGTRASIDGCYAMPFPLPDSSYGTPICPDLAQFGPTSAYYPSYEYYPMEYYACQNYYQNGEIPPNDYFTNPGAFMPPKGAYGDPVQYVDQLSGMYAATPGWTPESAAFAQSASQLGSMAYPAGNPLPHSMPFGVPPCDSFEPPYDVPHQFGPHWSAFVDRCMSAQLPVDSTTSPHSSSIRTDVHASRESAVAQPTGILLSCRVSSVTPPGSEDALDAYVQILVQTVTGAYVSRASDFVDSLSHFYTDANNLATHRFVAAQDLVSGLLLAVRLADNKWYRAELLVNSEEQLHVRLLDFGNTVDLPLASHCVAKLADNFSVACIPPMAVRCRVRTIRSLRTGAALNLLDAFAMLNDVQRVSSMGTYVRLSPRTDAEESVATSNDAELYVDD